MMNTELLKREVQASLKDNSPTEMGFHFLAQAIHLVHAGIDAAGGDTAKSEFSRKRLERARGFLNDARDLILAEDNTKETLQGLIDRYLAVCDRSLTTTH